MFHNDECEEKREEKKKKKLTSFCCSCTWPIWNHISSSVNGRGGSWTMYLKHYLVSQLLRHGTTRPVHTHLQALAKLLLLLVDDAQAKVDFVGLFEIRLHAHDLGKGLLGMLEGAVAIVEDANAIPEFGFLHRRRVSRGTAPIIHTWARERRRTLGSLR